MKKEEENDASQPTLVLQVRRPKQTLGHDNTIHTTGSLQRRTLPPKPTSFQSFLHKCESLIRGRTSFRFLGPGRQKEFPVTDWEVRWALIQRIFSLVLQDNHVSGLGNVREWYPAGEHLPDNAAEGINVTTRRRYWFRLLQIGVNEQFRCSPSISADVGWYRLIRVKEHKGKAKVGYTYPPMLVYQNVGACQITMDDSRVMKVPQTARYLVKNDKFAFRGKLAVIAMDEIGQCALVHPWCDDTGDRTKVVGKSDQRQDVSMV